MPKSEQAGKFDPGNRPMGLDVILESNVISEVPKGYAIAPLRLPFGSMIEIAVLPAIRSLHNLYATDRSIVFQLLKAFLARIAGGKLGIDRFQIQLVANRIS